MRLSFIFCHFFLTPKLEDRKLYNSRLVFSSYIKLTLSILLKTLLHFRAKYLQHALEMARLTALNTVIENCVHFGFM